MDVLRTLNALERLPERERRVLVRRYGQDGEAVSTLRDLAQDLQGRAEPELELHTQCAGPSNRRAS